MAQTKIKAGGFDADVITGTTALTAIPADTDEIIISDAGTLKRMDYSVMSQGHVKAWAHFNAASSPSLTDSFGVSSIAANSTGSTNVNLTTDLGNANYAVSTDGNMIVSTGAQQFAIVSCHPNSDAGTVQVDVRTGDIDGDTFAATDLDDIMIIVCGDNA